MGIGKLFLTSLTTVIITTDELAWVAANQINFSKCEFATAIKLVQLVDSGILKLGCRI